MDWWNRLFIVSLKFSLYIAHTYSCIKLVFDRIELYFWYIGYCHERNNTKRRCIYVLHKQKHHICSAFSNLFTFCYIILLFITAQSQFKFSNMLLIYLLFHFLLGNVELFSNNTGFHNEWNSLWTYFQCNIFLDKCQEGWTYFQPSAIIDPVTFVSVQYSGKCYKFFPDWKTWDEARAYCLSVAKNGVEIKDVLSYCAIDRFYRGHLHQYMGKIPMILLVT